MVARISSKTFFVGGLAAGAIAVAISLILRLFQGWPFIPEIASLTLFSLTPGEVESQAVETLGPLAKYSSFIGATVVNIVLYGLIGVLLGRLYDRPRWKTYLRKAVQSSIVAYLILLALTSVLLMLTEASTGVSILDFILYLIPPSIAFGFALPAFYQRIPLHLPAMTNIARKKKKVSADTGGSNKRSETTEVVKMDRRMFLRSAITSAVALPILFYGTSRLLFPTQQQSVQPIVPILPSQSGPIPAGFKDPLFSPLLQYEITPTELFYRIDINPIIPMVNAETWKLTFKGLVDKPYELTYQQLKTMPSVEQASTLGCISNKAGGDLISNALWKGVPLKNLLEQAQIKPNAKYIVFRCFDGYDVGIPLKKGLEDGTILAYEMNRAALTPEHGYPLRAIVPNIYGMMNAKWITEIELVDHVYEGFWQRKGWSNVARYNTLSSIVIPGSAAIRTKFRGFMPANSTLPSSNNSTTASSASGKVVSVGGIAFAGTRGISKVEVSIDNGTTWKDAIIKEPLSQYSWVLWAAELNLTGQQQKQQQEYKLSVRATDKSGNVQTSEIREPFPNGATGYHMINIQA